MNLLHPAELCILYVWVEAVITIEIVRARELNFSTQEKMSHTPTQNTASLVARCRWRNGYLCFFSGLFLRVQLLVEDGEPRQKPLHFNPDGFTQKNRLSTVDAVKFLSISTEIVLKIFRHEIIRLHSCLHE